MPLSVRYDMWAYGGQPHFKKKPRGFIERFRLRETLTRILIRGFFGDGDKSDRCQILSPSPGASMTKTGG